MNMMRIKIKSILKIILIVLAILFILFYINWKFSPRTVVTTQNIKGITYNMTSFLKTS